MADKKLSRERAAFILDAALGALIDAVEFGEWTAIDLALERARLARVEAGYMEQEA